MARPKVGFYWCASCGGCEESIVDMAESLVDILSAVEFVIFPVAMDFKRSDVEALADGEIAITMINGSIRTSEQEEMAKLLRSKSQIIVAYGTCAHLGGIPSLANLFSREQILRYIYHEAPTVVNPDGTEPLSEAPDSEGHVPTLPRFHEVTRSLDQVVEVDYVVPGCAPDPRLVKEALAALLSPNPPPKGSILAPNIALCSTCPLLDTKPATMKIAEFKRPHLHPIDPDTCLLAQGFLCMGTATRSGCGERCIRAHMPCTGCYGPLSGVHDHGAKALSALASLIDADDENKIDEVLETIPDPVGSLYRYGTAKSLLRHRSMAGAGK